MTGETVFSGVLAVADEPDRLPRVTSLGSELARQLATVPVTGVLLTRGVADDPDRALLGGCDEVFRIRCESPSGFTPEYHAEILTRLVMERKPVVVLFDSNKTSAELCARVSQRLGLPAATGCRRVWSEGESLMVERPAHGGKFTAVQRFGTKRPFFVSAIPPDFSQTGARVHEGRLNEVGMQVSQTSVVMESEEKRSSGEGLERAERIVAVGRGLRRKDDLGMIEGLAAALGARIAATRPLTEDLKWLPHDAQVGISGRTVKPKLYVACGVSGQIQHAAGMRESRIVVAINTDKDAPIFQETDYGIIGDLYLVVPALTRALLGRRAAPH